MHSRAPEPGGPATQGGRSANLASALGIAASVVAAVRHGKTLDDSLKALGGTAPAAERAAAQDIAYRACRRLNLLESLVAKLIQKSNPAIDPLAQVAISELMDHPERAHMIVDEAVKAIAAGKGAAFKGVLNAVLRRFSREHEALVANALAEEPCRLGYPPWWIARMRTDWPDAWQDILAQGNTRAPMMMRTNRRRTHPAQVLASLADNGIEARVVSGDAIRLSQPQPAQSLPGFSQGMISVQDLGAQLAAPLLDIRPGMRVLDACAAPGGKTAHVLELADCDVLAVDRDPTRLATLKVNLDRLGLTAETRVADAGKPDTWWDGQPFDRILLDAPCTASGVIRRHPDGKWLKRAGDIAGLAREQARLMSALWHVLRPGGKLLYATCSVFLDENQRQTALFLTSHPDALQLPIDIPVAHHDGQILPNTDHDGFYYALLAKAG